MCRAEFASIFEEERVALGGGPRHAHFRETMQNVLIVIHLIIVVALVGVVLLQRSEGGGLGMGSGGGGGVGAGRRLPHPARCVQRSAECDRAGA